MPRARAKVTADARAVVSLPPSATHAAVAWIGVSTMLASVALLNFWTPFEQIADQALMVMGCTALGLFIPDLLWQKVQRRTLIPAANPGDWLRVGTKCVGLAGSVGFIALLYWLAPEYHQGRPFYGNYYLALERLFLPWAVMAPIYIYWVDRRLAQPRDGLWQMGRLALFQWQGLDPRVIGQHLLGWLVKGFFLPLMFTYCCDNLNKLLHYGLTPFTSFNGIFDWTYFTLYFIDVSLVSMTYLMSLKATDTHIRSTEPTALGWISALVCYQPFWSLISKQYLDYDTGKPWAVWLAQIPWLYYPWACMIILLVATYVWATIAFGARFSNLTHRGIITNGPYRFTKHPAYLSKNLSWWLISMPFMLSGGWHETIRRCLLLAALNLIYYLRAKTEERHLGLDPVYVRYARWIDEHGALRGLNRIALVGRLARWRPTFSAYTPPTPLC
ncbi:MAG: methyltransferase family protein [Steroidobacteraceae bacterium]